MKYLQRLLLCLAVIAIATGFISACSDNKEVSAKKRVLIFSLTKGFHHNSITQGNAFFMAAGSDLGFETDTTTDATKFTVSNLSRYKAVVWLNTTGDVLNAAQQQAFESYIRSGGGYVGIHAASDTEFDWPWYNSLVGAYFLSHPKIQEAQYITLDKTFPATAHLADSFLHKDEIYDFKSLKQDSLHFLIRVNESSYEGGKMGSFHPIAWYHHFQGGRAFYSAFGHTPESYNSPMIATHFRKGLLWAMGELP